MADVFLSISDNLAVASPGSIADGAFSPAADIDEWTNEHNAPFAAFKLNFTIGSAGTANSVVNLYAQPLNIVGTNDAEVPDSNFKNVYLGSFLYNNPGTGTQYSGIQVGLPNITHKQVYQFYLENELGVSITDFDLYVQPII